MEVTTVGGGPGGLYANLLLKQRHPDWSVTVLERNPPDITYGFGIVFPDRGLSRLADVDPATHAAITEAFIEWNPFDIHYRGQRYRCGGHRFGSLMRTELLAILQERAREVGVELEFETDVSDPEELAAASDLLIGADGLRSTTRAAYADEFGTRTIEGQARFSWFGTDQPFEALSHIFVENDDGTLCGHTYPGRISTFVVDCDVETWRNAGLEGMDEAAYLDYLEGVFADYLDGHPLRSEQDRWRTFTTVWNESWVHDNVALLGDAAHTAHYSIGSGTTLALEDGMGLARAFEGFDGDLEAALAEYERGRREFVEPLQRASERSRRHFERIRRFFGTPGERFALHHLTRSGRLTYGSVRDRDPAYIEAFDRWFARNETPASVPETEPPGPPGDQPMSLGDRTSPNRFVRVGEPTWRASNGEPTSATRDRLCAMGTAGYGLVLTQPLAVSADGRPSAGSPGLYEPTHQQRWQATIEGTPDDVLVGAHLIHAGPHAGRDPRVFGVGGWTDWEAAWSKPRLTEFPNPPSVYEPASLDAATADGVRTAFKEAAERANAAGFDYLQLHAGPGSLLGECLEAAGDDRTGVYPSELPAEVVDVVREAWGRPRPLGLTLPVAGRESDDRGIEAAIETAAGLADRGLDLVAPVAGPSNSRGSPLAVEEVSTYCDHLSHATDLLTLGTAYTTDRDKVDTLVATGRADLCTFAGPVDKGSL